MRLSPFLLVATLLIVGCYSPYRTGTTHKAEGDFIRVPREDMEPDASKPFKDKNRYHSVYHTDNPYYDARNLILDGDLSKALELLTVDTHSLDYPNRAAMWAFITMCKLNRREEAMQFLKEFVVPISLEPGDTGVISTMLMYFLGSLKDNDLYMRFKNWDELDHCPAYYYFGAYKKYYAEDFVTGDDYIGRSYRTRMINYSEYKFASVEVRGYVARDPGQYTDFPLNKSLSDEMAIAAELMEGYVVADDNRAMAEGYTGENGLDDYEFNNYLEQTDSEYGFTEDGEEDKEYLAVIPENLKSDQFVVPAPDGMGWEVMELMDLKKVLIEEALSMMDNMRGGNDYFMLRENEEAQYFPTTRAFNSYFSRLDDYLKETDRYMDDYGLDYGTVTLYLREGDILSGCVVPCRVYNITFDTYTDDVLVSFNLLFAVNEDRSVELRHQVISVLADLRELKNKDRPEPPNVGQSDFY